MQTRFTPSLETLDERLTPSIWDPTAAQTRQISIVVDLAPPELDLRASASQMAIPSVTDLVIDPYNGRPVVTDGPVTGRITGIAVDPSLGDGVDREGEYSWAYLVKRFLASSPTTLEGHECLVFFLGGIPSPDAVPQYWVFGTELPSNASSHIRHRMFSIVDRTQLVAYPPADLTSSLSADDSESVRRRSHVTTHSFDLDRPGGAAQVQGTLFVAKQQARRAADGEMGLADSPGAGQDRIGPFFEFKSNRLQPSAAEDGTRYKPLFAPLILELDNAHTSADDLVGWDFHRSTDASPGPSVLLQRLANPSIPDGGGYAGTHVLYQDVFIPAAEPIALARDAKSSGM